MPVKTTFEPGSTDGSIEKPVTLTAELPLLVTVTSKNPQPIGHDIAVEGNGVNAKGPVVENGGTSKFSVNLKPGTYTFFCTVPGHREGGMVGKLTVK